MILADKIIELRKKNGWSQEELAEKLDVSRQSISKWEGAQSVPDMNRIIAMSQIFGVSTDLLLKDELDLGQESWESSGEDYEPTRVITMEEANAFLDHKIFASGRVALGVLLCILSPVLLIVLSGAQELGALPLSEHQAVGLGLIALISMIGAAVAMFVTTGIKHSRFEYIEEEQIETAYGVSGLAKERRERYSGEHARLLTWGIVLCVMAVGPIFLSLLFFGEDNTLPHVLSVGIMLILIAAGVTMIVRTSIIWGGYMALLEEGDYSRKEKAESKKIGPLASVYWLAVTAGFLAWSFITNAWDRTWIVWPIAGVSFGIVAGIARMLRSKE
ncbi:MAG: helix-turn-helix transcriptional regulator [Firmicutes bacterium]|nr:helix-turn-helix transcriptional regulator [Bacillota bacterium]